MYCLKYSFQYCSKTGLKRFSVDWSKLKQSVEDLTKSKGYPSVSKAFENQEKEAVLGYSLLLCFLERYPLIN